MSPFQQKGLLSPRGETWVQVDVLDEYSKIPIQFEDVDMKIVMALVKRHMIYAYDGYTILCAKHFRVPLLTLDKSMVAVAEKESVKVVEV